MKIIKFVVLLAVPLLLANGITHGPIPAEQRDLIHQLATENESIHRTVEVTETGYRATTTANDAELADVLRKHVAYMQVRVDSGLRVRRWDPAYEEFFRHHEDIAIDVAPIDNGLEVTVVGATPEAILVAQNHGSIVSQFVDHGFEALYAEHDTVIGSSSDEVEEPVVGLERGGKNCGQGCGRNCRQAEQ